MIDHDAVETFSDLMAPTTVYVLGAPARMAWDTWNVALAARCDHELACLIGCDTGERHCERGLLLVRAEASAWLAYDQIARGSEAA